MKEHDLFFLIFSSSLYFTQIFRHYSEQIFWKSKNKEGSKLSNEVPYLLILNQNDAIRVWGPGGYSWVSQY